MTCEHMEFNATIQVVRLTDTEDGPAKGFLAEVRIECRACQAKMQFLGLETGCDTQGARVSIDGLEAYLAITPEGTKPNPFQRMQYGIKGFNA